MVASPSDPLSDDERAELERLREHVRTGSKSDRPLGAGGTGHRAWRWTAAGLLLVLVAVLAFSAVLARFARSEVLDTDRYIETVTPLAQNPTLQDGLADRITTAIMTEADIENITRDALTALTENAPNVPPAVIGLAPVLTQQAQSFIEQTVRSLLGSDQFETLWIEANKRAHTALVGVLTGDTKNAAVEVDDSGAVSISLKPIIENVRGRLQDRGFSFADKIPDIDKSFVIFESPDLVKAQNAVSALDKASAILPWLTLLVAAAAVWAAPKGSRRRALSLVGLAVAVAMLLLAIGLSIGRSIYLDAVPADAIRPESAEILIDTLLVPLKTMLRAVAVLGIVIALVGYLSGTSTSATAIRRTFRTGVDSVRGNSGRAPHPIESYAANFLLPLRILIVAVAIIVLVFWDYPSGLVVMVTVIIAVIALFVLELVARPAIGYRPPADALATEPTGAATPARRGDADSSDSTT